MYYPVMTFLAEAYYLICRVFLRSPLEEGEGERKAMRRRKKRTAEEGQREEGGRRMEEEGWMMKGERM